MDKSLPQQLFSDGYYVSGAHSYQQISLCTIFQKKIFDLVESGKVMADSSQFLNPFLKIDGRDADGVLFTGSINIAQDDFICQCQRLGKLGQQRLGSGIGMGLEYTPQFPVRILVGGRQRGLDFRGVVGIIVNDGYACDFAFILETPIRTGEGVEAFLYFFFRYLQKFGQRYGGQARWIHCEGRAPSGSRSRFFWWVPDAVEGGMSQFIISDIGRLCTGPSDPLGRR